MDYSAGFAKDLIAFFGFIIAFVIIYNTNDLHKLKPLFLVSLLLAMFIDGLYSIFPEFHNTTVGYNAPTYALVAVVLLFIPSLCFLYK
jgi:uncharacterized protein with PQ loop repeat